jgi:hypothetical protein
MHESKSKSCCENCEFWDVLAAHKDRGQCHRHPPTVSDADYPDSTLWPRSYDFESCGEHSATRTNTVDAEQLLNDLKPDEIRYRLNIIDGEASALRVLLRAVRHIEKGS